MSALSRLDDWVNPIAVKELRQAVRGKFVNVALLLSLLAQLIAVAVIAVFSSLDPSSGSNANAAGPGAFTAIFTVLFTACVFLIPIYSGFRMAAERADSNVDLFYITTIRPRTIVIGKVIAVIGLVVLLFSASLPFLVFSYVLRGVDFVSIIVLLAIALTLVVSQSIVALFIGALPTSKPFKIFLALGFFLLTFATYAPMLGMTAQLLQMGMGVLISDPRFWATFASFAASMVAIDAVLMVLTTAIITPPAANRALPVRIMLALAWLLSYAGVAWMVFVLRTPAVMEVWAVAQVGLVSLVLLSGTSERESWGPRVARTIPKNPILRAVGFIFYSGGAGGTLWAILMYAATIGLYYGTALMSRVAPTATTLRFTQVLADAALAMIGYAMTAVLLRRTLLRRVPAARTWGIVLALFILLTVLPPIGVFARDADSDHYATWVHGTTILNPFPTARTAHLRDARTITLGLWAGLMLLANGRWFVHQARKFRRLEPQKMDDPPPFEPLPALQELTSE